MQSCAVDFLETETQLLGAEAPEAGQGSWECSLQPWPQWQQCSQVSLSPSPRPWVLQSKPQHL